MTTPRGLAKQKIEQRHDMLERLAIFEGYTYKWQRRFGRDFIGTLREQIKEKRRRIKAEIQEIKDVYNKRLQAERVIWPD